MVYKFFVCATTLIIEGLFCSIAYAGASTAYIATCSPNAFNGEMTIDSVGFDMAHGNSFVGVPTYYGRNFFDPSFYAKRYLTEEIVSGEVAIIERGDRLSRLQAYFEDTGIVDDNRYFLPSKLRKHSLLKGGNSEETLDLEVSQHEVSCAFTNREGVYTRIKMKPKYTTAKTLELAMKQCGAGIIIDYEISWFTKASGEPTQTMVVPAHSSCDPYNVSRATITTDGNLKIDVRRTEILQENNQELVRRIHARRPR